MFSGPGMQLYRGKVPCQGIWRLAAGDMAWMDRPLLFDADSSPTYELLAWNLETIFPAKEFFYV
jgi:hypothetical protein